MFRLYTIILFFSAGFYAFGAVPVPSGERLKNLCYSNFPNYNVFIGAAINWTKLYENSGELLDQEFQVNSPENAAKQAVIHPRPGEWNWNNFDAWMTWSENTGQLVRAHSPIGPQCGTWVKEDVRTGLELSNLMEDW
jgi:GH35 family endo-1,4-beta-xylanase